MKRYNLSLRLQAGEMHRLDERVIRGGYRSRRRFLNAVVWSEGKVRVFKEGIRAGSEPVPFTLWGNDYARLVSVANAAGVSPALWLAGRVVMATDAELARPVVRRKYKLEKPIDGRSLWVREKKLDLSVVKLSEKEALKHALRCMKYAGTEDWAEIGRRLKMVTYFSKVTQRIGVTLVDLFSVACRASRFDLAGRAFVFPRDDIPTSRKERWAVKVMTTSPVMNQKLTSWWEDGGEERRKERLAWAKERGPKKRERSFEIDMRYETLWSEAGRRRGGGDVTVARWPYPALEPKPVREEVGNGKTVKPYWMKLAKWRRTTMAQLELEHRQERLWEEDSRWGLIPRAVLASIHSGRLLRAEWDSFCAREMSIPEKLRVYPYPRSGLLIIRFRQWQAGVRRDARKVVQISVDADLAKKKQIEDRKLNADFKRQARKDALANQGKLFPGER